MIISLLVAEAVLLLLVVVDRWLDIAPFNNLAAQRARSFGARARDTFIACAPILLAIACTVAWLAPEAPAWMGLTPIVALSFALATAVRLVWLPWLNAAPAPVRADGIRRTTTSARALRPQSRDDDVTTATAATVTASQESDVHAFLEPRRAGAVVPSTFACLTHAHATACLLMAVVALLAP